MCGSSTVRGASSRRGVHLGLAFVHVEPGREQTARVQRVGERRLVDHRCRARCSRAPRSASSARGGGRRSGDACRAPPGTCRLTMSRVPEQLVEIGDVARRPRSAGARGGAPASPKPAARAATARPMRPKPTSPSVAPCTSRPRYCVDAPARPRAGAQVALGVGREPRRREDQQEREVGGRLVEHTRRVAHDDAVRRPRRRTSMLS